MTFNCLGGRILLLFLALQTAACRELSERQDCGTCIPTWGKCGGSFFNVSGTCCDDRALCITKNFWFAQCLTEDWAAINVANGWDGTLLDCEGMPLDVLAGPLDEMAPGPAPNELECEEGVCTGRFQQCGGGYNTSTPCCNPDSECIVKNWFYAQCLPEATAAHNVVVEGWDGRLLHCEDMPADAPKGPAFWTHTPLNSQQVRAKTVAEALEEDVISPGSFPKPGIAPARSALRPKETCGIENMRCCLKNGQESCNSDQLVCTEVATGGPAMMGITKKCMPCQVASSMGSDSNIPQCSDQGSPGEEEDAPVPITVRSVPKPKPPVVTPEPKAPEELAIQPPEEVAPETPLNPEPVEPMPEPMEPAVEPVKLSVELMEPAVQPLEVTIDPMEPDAGPVDNVTTPEPTKSDFNYQGDLTYYGGAGEKGHCTSTYVPEGYTTVALNAPQYAGGSMCGTCVHACFDNLELGQGERCFDAIIDDECPECKEGDLDLGESGNGRWPVAWQIIKCSELPGALNFTTQGSNQFYAKVKAQGGPSSIASMSCHDMPGQLTPDGFFEFMSTAGDLACGMDCEVVFSNGFGTGSGNVTAAQLGNSCN